MHCGKGMEIIVCRQDWRTARKKERFKWGKAVKVDQGKGSESPKKAKHDTMSVGVTYSH